MRTLVSVSCDLPTKVENPGTEARTSRHAPDRVTEAMDRVISEIDSEVDGLSQRATRQVLERVEW